VTLTPTPTSTPTQPLALALPLPLPLPLTLSCVKGCEQHGRNDLAAVAGEVEGKSEKEVAKY